MDTNKIVYRDDLSERQNMETLFNCVRHMMEEFEAGRVSYGAINTEKGKTEKIKADTEYLSIMTGVEI